MFGVLREEPCEVSVVLLLLQDQAPHDCIVSGGFVSANPEVNNSTLWREILEKQILNTQNPFLQWKE